LWYNYISDRDYNISEHACFTAGEFFILEAAMKHLLKLLDLTSKEITEILDLADKLKAEQKAGVNREPLKGKTLAMIFEKNSTRTRVSFETGIYQLGGQGIFLSGSESQIGRGEPVQDTARVLSRYCDGIMIRTFAQKTVEDLARWSTIPIINGLTDFSHPCQVLADLQTIRERKGKLAGLKAAYIGDGNNMANSIIVGALKCGMTVSAACPAGYEPSQIVLEFATLTGGFEFTSDIRKAAEGADVIFTDVWASMGMEKEVAARKKAFIGYCVDDGIMKLTNNAMIQHCLPAHRGEEITEEVFEAHAEEIFDEAENRLHAQKAVMELLMR
jgi:ornithine carbamoyltransferase